MPVTAIHSLEDNLIHIVMLQSKKPRAFTEVILV